MSFGDGNLHAEVERLRWENADLRRIVAFMLLRMRDIGFDDELPMSWLRR